MVGKVCKILCDLGKRFVCIEPRGKRVDVRAALFLELAAGFCSGVGEKVDPAYVPRRGSRMRGDIVLHRLPENRKRGVKLDIADKTALRGRKERKQQKKAERGRENAPENPFEQKITVDSCLYKNIKSVYTGLWKLCAAVSAASWRNSS